MERKTKLMKARLAAMKQKNAATEAGTKEIQDRTAKLKASNDIKKAALAHDEKNKQDTVAKLKEALHGVKKKIRHFDKAIKQHKKLLTRNTTAERLVDALVANCKDTGKPGPCKGWKGKGKTQDLVPAKKAAPAIKLTKSAQPSYSAAKAESAAPAEAPKKGSKLVKLLKKLTGDVAAPKSGTPGMIYPKKAGAQPTHAEAPKPKAKAPKAAKVKAALKATAPKPKKTPKPKAPEHATEEHKRAADHEVKHQAAKTQYEAAVNKRDATAKELLNYGGKHADLGAGLKSSQWGPNAKATIKSLLEQHKADSAAADKVGSVMAHHREEAARLKAAGDAKVKASAPPKAKKPKKASATKKKTKVAA